MLRFFLFSTGLFLLLSTTLLAHFRHQTEPIWVMFSTQLHGEFGLYRIQLDGSRLERVSPSQTGAIWIEAWSPDGVTMLVYDPGFGVDGVYRLQRAGATHDPFLVNVEVRAWQTAGIIVQVHDPITRADLVLVNAKGQLIRRLTAFEGDENFALWRGAWVYFSTNHQHQGNVYRVQVNTQEIQPLTQGAALEWVAGASDDWLVISSDRDGRRGLYRLPMDGGTLVPIPTRGDEAHFVTWQGDWLYYRAVSGRVSPLLRVNLDTGQTERVLAFADYDTFQAWSPDGTWMIYESREDIYRVQPNGYGAENLTRNRALDRFGAWAGEWMVYESFQDGGNELYRMRLDGGGRERLTVTPNGVAFQGVAPKMGRAFHRWELWGIGLALCLAGSMQRHFRQKTAFSVY